MRWRSVPASPVTAPNGSCWRNSSAREPPPAAALWADRLPAPAHRASTARNSRQHLPFVARSGRDMCRDPTCDRPAPQRGSCPELPRVTAPARSRNSFENPAEPCCSAFTYFPRSIRFSHASWRTPRRTPTCRSGLPDYYAQTYDPFVAHGYAAAVTATNRLGTSVSLVIERDPGATHMLARPTARRGCSGAVAGAARVPPSVMNRATETQVGIVVTAALRHRHDVVDLHQVGRATGHAGERVVVAAGSTVPPPHRAPYRRRNVPPGAARA